MVNVNFARNIDYWFGIPICFILSIFNTIQKIFIPRNPEKFEPRKIMFLELSEIGSVILGYSAIKKAKEMFPNAKLYFWIFQVNQDSIRILDIIPNENIITMRNDNLLYLFRDILRNLWHIWKEDIDVIIDMELFSRFSSILSYLSGAKIRVGFYKFSLEGLYRGNLHTHKIIYNPYMHINKNFLALVYSLESHTKEMPLLKISLMSYETTVPKVKSSREGEEHIWCKLKEINDQIDRKNKIVILNPGFNELLSIRRWPLENYIELAKRLLNDRQIFIVIIGVVLRPFAREKISLEIANPHFINLIGKTSVAELIDLYNISTLLISHDCGAPHIASLTDVNIIALFGPETPILYSPLTPHKKVLFADFACSPCITAYNHRHSVCKNNRCMKAITVDEVYAIAQKILYKFKNKNVY